MTDNEQKKPTRKVTPKTIVMQMEVESQVRVPDPGEAGEEMVIDRFVAWKDMTGADFGGKPDVVANQSVVPFTDTAAAWQKLKAALATGVIKPGGTYRVASHGDPITPTVEPKQMNVVTF
jgi:hypothetical protein